MSNKRSRGDDNVTRDNYNDDDEGDEGNDEVGKPFERASETEISQRKILKVRKKGNNVNNDVSGGGALSTTKQTFPAPSSNPFANFQGLAPSAPSTSSSFNSFNALPISTTSNSFNFTNSEKKTPSEIFSFPKAPETSSNFSLTNKDSSSTISQNNNNLASGFNFDTPRKVQEGGEKLKFSFPSSSESKIEEKKPFSFSASENIEKKTILSTSTNAPSSFPISVPSTIKFGIIPGEGKANQRTEMEKLNKQFSENVNERLRTSVHYDWTPMLEDYIRYAKRILSQNKTPIEAKKTIPSFPTPSSVDVNKTPDIKKIEVKEAISTKSPESSISFKTTPSIDAKKVETDSKKIPSASFNFPVSSPKPDAGNSFTFTAKSTDIPKTESTPSFSFSSKSNVSEPLKLETNTTFSFGTKATETSKASIEASPSFSFGAKSTSFSSGLEKKTENPAAPTSFNFGAKLVSESPKTEATPSFNFGGSSSFSGGMEKKVDTPAPIGFNFGAKTITASDSGKNETTPSFSFSATKSPETSITTAAPSFTLGGNKSTIGFNFGGTSSALDSTSKIPSFTPLVSASANEAVEDEEAEKLAKQEQDMGKTVETSSAASREETKYESKAKLFKMKDGAYVPIGTGTLRLWRNKDSDNRRLVMFTDIGKNILNSSLYPTIKPEVANKNNVKIGLMDGGVLTMHLIKVKDEDMANQLKICIESMAKK